jgi:3',5'-cyclic AMP phosphodiesterase CpdA
VSRSWRLILAAKLDPMRILLVTDSHLADSAPACNDNWREVRRYAQRSASGLTVHLGDIALDAPGDRSHSEAARRMCEAWPTPLRFLPGNHDIGDNPLGPEHPAKDPLDPQLLESFQRDFGPDFWTMEIERWLIIGLNAQLFGSNGAHEQEQWRLLDECARNAGARPVVLMLHKPLFQKSREDSAPHIRYVPIAPRQRLLQLLARMNLKLVLNGHTHQYLDRTIEGVRHIWVPSTAFFIPDTDQERVGEKITGVGQLELDGEGYRFDLVCPEGVKRNSFVDQPFYRALR